MIDFVGRKRWFFLISAIAITVAIISLVVSTLTIGAPLRPGIDFSGGTSMTISFTPKMEQNEATQLQGQLRREVTEFGHPEAIIQFQRDSRNFLIRMKFISPQEVNELRDRLEAAFNRDVEISVPLEMSPIIAAETAGNASIAVIIAAVAMLLYITWAFRRMPKPFRWGTCAIIALIHDVLIVVGIFSILGKVANVEVDAMFITGLLAVVGYSINNTVVVFDRIRENMSKGISPDFAVTVNSSLIETLGRSLNTSLTTLCVILALFLFGGATIHRFILVLLIGLLAGTYSSLFIAGPLLVVWEKREWRQLFSWLPFVKKPA
jgi:preprotein translocase subunit SecF